MIGFWCHPGAGLDVEVDEHACVLAETAGGGQAAPPGRLVDGKKES